MISGGENLYVPRIGTRKSHEHVVSKLIPVNRVQAWQSSKGITNLHCCVEGETDAHHLMAFVAKGQETCTLKDIAIYILGAVLHHNMFSGTQGTLSAYHPEDC